MPELRSRSAGRLGAILMWVMAALVLPAVTPSAAEASGEPFRIPAPRSSPSDDRAEFHRGNVTTCDQIDGVPADAVQLGAHGWDDAADAYVTGTTAGTTRLNVDITDEGEAAGVVVEAVVVKGGNGYNVYRDPYVPPTLEPAQNYISPYNDGGNIPDISHWFVCYSLGGSGTGTDTQPLIISKVVVAPPGPPAEDLPTEYVVQVSCAGDGFAATFEATFGAGGGITIITDELEGAPDGTVCVINEQGTSGFPEGSEVSYRPETANTEGVTLGSDPVKVDIVNDFSGVDVRTGMVQLNKIVENEGGADGPDSYTVGVGCVDGTSEAVTLPGDGGPGDRVVEVTANTYCTVAEDTSSLPEGTTVEFSVNGGPPEPSPVFQVGDGETVEVTVTNTIPSPAPTPEPTDTAGPAETTSPTASRAPLPDTGSGVGTAGIAALLLAGAGAASVLRARARSGIRRRA